MNRVGSGRCENTSKAAQTRPKWPRVSGQPRVGPTPLPSERGHGGQMSDMNLTSFHPVGASDRMQLYHHRACLSNTPPTTVNSILTSNNCFSN
ncbi:hypothetical protein PGT21_032489 [Puccinia graminis f. sp. tritici]|uniref:Uncharacterized protein n=1 Tax=Puccinia graminis f. sp. tritici TaxID=56615 RepID=A0A5B0PZB9_PUCGR|nr:hypothetical protein PGT21_032489 [Puccinia graminis f. sp. tritici]